MRRSRGRPRPATPTGFSRNPSRGPFCASESSNCCPLEKLTHRRRTPRRRRVRAWADAEHERLARSARSAVGKRGGQAIELATPMDTSEDQFQEEVLHLFAEEGLEWIKQIKVALQELESGVTLDKEKKHYDIILRSLTNLMGSAATVELAALQKLTLALVPLLQAMQTKKV